MQSFAALIDLWPDMAVLSSDTGVKESHLRTMKARNSVPPDYWPAFVDSAKRRGIPGVTFDVLAGLYARRQRVRRMAEAS
jgi:hypothetical protein